MKVSSVEIAFRLDRIKEKVLNLMRDLEQVVNILQEKKIFLYDCLRAGLKIKYTH